MTPLPDELLREAREIAHDIYQQGASVRSEYALVSIARALLAERERAARIAREFYDIRHDTLARVHGYNIATAILPDKDPKS